MSIMERKKNADYFDGSSNTANRELQVRDEELDKAAKQPELS